MIVQNPKEGVALKTLILNGSPRKDGDTVSLINKLIEQLDS